MQHRFCVKSWQSVAGNEYRDVAAGFLASLPHLATVTMQGCRGAKLGMTLLAPL